MTGYVQVYRAAPWSRDPSVSLAGHESGPRSQRLASVGDIDAWIQAHAPEVDTTAPYVTMADGPDYFYILSGRDARGYRTDVYVQRYEREG
jgi:hypothetical protein